MLKNKKLLIKVGILLVLVGGVYFAVTLISNQQSKSSKTYEVTNDNSFAKPKKATTFGKYLSGEVAGNTSSNKNINNQAYSAEQRALANKLVLAVKTSLSCYFDKYDFYPNSITDIADMTPECVVPKDIVLPDSLKNSKNFLTDLNYLVLRNGKDFQIKVPTLKGEVYKATQDTVEYLTNQ